MAGNQRGAPITPTAFYKDPMAALTWLEAAFGFEVAILLTDAEGGVAHAEMAFRGAHIGVAGEWESPPLLGPARARSPASLDGQVSQFMWLQLEEGLDAHCERARAAGANIVQAPEDQFYGDRTYRALDPEGHVWCFRQPVRQVSAQEMEQATGLTYKVGG
jgi:uncharacterized glyoxalase superfamily protein PhnB